MRRRLVVALLDTSHNGGADEAFRSEVLLQDSLTFPPGVQHPPDRGHHFPALAANAVTCCQKAVPGMVLPCDCFLGHELPSRRPPQWPTTS